MVAFASPSVAFVETKPKDFSTRSRIFENSKRSLSVKAVMFSGVAPAFMLFSEMNLYNIL